MINISAYIKSPLVSEIKCAVNRLRDIYDYIKDNPSLRVNIQYNETKIIDKLLKEIDKIKIITQNNYTICANSLQITKELITLGYNAYVNIFVTDWELLNNLKDIGVSDVIIDGQLGFSVDILKNLKYPLKYRVNPMYSISASIIKSKHNIKSFFIRPEDLHFYEDVIDYIECPDKYKEQAFINIYSERKYFGNLINLNPTIDSEQTILNPYIPTDFCKQRLNCQQKCQHQSCHRCNYCIQTAVILSLSNLRKNRNSEKNKVIIL